jgi:hypothetical protein
VNLTDPLPEDPRDPEPPPEGLLSDEQAVRALALAIAKPFLTTVGVVSRSAPDVGDLITLAQWIVEGGDTSPPYPFLNGDVTVLGPGIFASGVGGLINWNGVNYEPQGDDGHDDDDD